MAGSKPVAREEVFDKDVFTAPQAEAERLIDTMAKAEAGMKAILKASRSEIGIDPKTVQEVNKLSDSIKNVNLVSKALEETTKKRIATEKKASEQMRLQQGLLGGLQAKIKELNAQKLMAKTPDDIRKVNKELDKTKGKLNELKNLGAKSSNTFGNALSSFQFKFNFLGNLMANFAQAGLSAIKNFASGSVDAFIDAEKNAHSLAFSVKEVAGESDEAFKLLIRQSQELQKSSIFSDDSIQQQQKALLNFGLTTDQVRKLMPAIADLATAQGIDLADATDKVIKGIGGQTRGLKDAGIVMKDTGSKTQNLSLVMDKLGKFSGAAGDALGTVSGKAAQADNEMDDLQETIGAKLAPALKSIQLALLETTKFVINLFTETGNLDQLLDDIGAKAEAKEFLSKAAKNLAEFGEVGEKAIMKMNNEFSALSAMRDKMSKKDFLAQMKSDYAFLDSQVKAGKLSATEFAALTLVYNKFLTDMSTDTSKFIHTIKDDNTKAIEDTADTELEFRKKLEEDYLAHLEKIKGDIADEELKKEKEHQDKRKKQFEDSNKEHLEVLKDRKELEEEMYTERMQNEENARKKHIDKLIELEQLYSDAIFDGIEKRQSAKSDALDKELEKIDASIALQTERQMAGLTNTLEFQEKERAKALDKKAQLEKRERLASEARDLAEVFLKFLKGYAETGDVNANAKAWAQTLIAKGITKAIVGSFYDGVEDIGTAANPLDNKGGRIAVLHDNESVVTKKGTRDNPGLTTAMNAGTVDDYVKKNYLDYYTPANAPRQAAPASQLPSIDKGLARVEKAIRESANSITADTLGNLIETSTKNGVKSIVHKKTRWC